MPQSSVRSTAAISQNLEEPNSWGFQMRQTVEQGSWTEIIKWHSHCDSGKNSSLVLCFMVYVALS